MGGKPAEGHIPDAQGGAVTAEHGEGEVSVQQVTSCRGIRKGGLDVSFRAMVVAGDFSSRFIGRVTCGRLDQRVQRVRCESGLGRADWRLGGETLTL